MTTKEMVRKEDFNSAIGFAQDEETWGAQTDTADFKIPKIILMQKTADLVEDGKCKKGDLIENLNDTVLGNIMSKPIELIVFETYKKVQTFIDNKWESTRAYQPGDVNLPYKKHTHNGQQRQFKRIIGYYALLPSEIKSGGELAFPYAIDFKGLNADAGQYLSTCITKLSAFRKPSAAKVFKLAGEETEIEGKKWLRYTIEMTRNTTPEEIAFAKQWYQSLKVRSDVDIVEDDKPAADPMAPPMPTDSEIPF